MHPQTPTVPTWILIVSGLFALMEMGVSYSLCFDPLSVVETADLTAPGVQYLFYMWAARQFALGITFAVATIRRSAAMLTAAYVFFLVMFLGDLAVGISQSETALIGAAVVMSLISSVLIYLLNKR